MKGNKVLTKIINLMGLSSLIFFVFPLAAYAASAEDAYTDMNSILWIASIIGGFMVLIGIIRSGIKLATAQDNPQNRTVGIIGLCFAFLGGYMIYKAVDILNLFF